MDAVCSREGIVAYAKVVSAVSDALLVRPVPYTEAMATGINAELGGEQPGGGDEAVTQREFCDGCNGSCGRLLDLGLGPMTRELRLPLGGIAAPAEGALIAAHLPYSAFSLLTACAYVPALVGLLLGVALAPTGMDTQAILQQALAGCVGVVGGLGTSALLIRVGLPRWLWGAVTVRQVDAAPDTIAR